MRQSFPVLRRAAVMLIAVLSVVGAFFLVWSVGTLEGLRQLNNAQMTGIMALLLLPVAALVAWELDRRASVLRGTEPERDAAVHLHDAAEVRDPEFGHRHRVRSGSEERVGR